MTSRTQRVLAALTTLTTLAALLLLLASPPTSVGAATTQNNGCLGVTGTFSTFAIPIAGTAAPKTIDPGQNTTLSGTGVTIGVDSQLVTAGVATGLVAAAPTLADVGTPDPLDPTVLQGQNAVVAATGSVKLQIKGTNTTQGLQTATNPAPANVTFWVVNDGTTITIYSGTPNPPSNSNLTVITRVVVPIPLGDTTWTASGGNIALAENEVVPSSLTKPTGPDKTASPLQILPKINGRINVPFYCWSGTASADGTALVPGAAGAIDTVTVSASSTSSSSSSSTSSSSTSSTSSTSSSTTSTSTTSTTTEPTSTTSSTTPESPTVSGTATYATSCTNTVTKDTSNIPFTLTATGPRRTTSGNAIVITNQNWKATVPSSVLTTAINLGLLNPGDIVSAVVSPNLKGTNTDPADNHAADVPTQVGPIQVDGNGDAVPATATFAVSDLTYRATGGDATFAMGTTKMLVSIGALKITFTCTPTAPVPVVLTTLVTGPQLATTTTTTTADAAVLAATTELPRTGPDSHTLWIEIVTGLLLIQIGYMLWSITKPPRRSRAGRR